MKSSRILILGFLCLLLGADSCKKFDLNTDNLELALDLNIIKTNYEITFLDAVNSLPIGENEEVVIRVTVYGPDSQWVLDPSGNRYEEYKALSGRLALSLDPYKAKPSESDPVIFIIHAEADGFMPVSKRIETAYEGGHNEAIVMVRQTDPPSGSDIIHVDNAGTADQGQVTTDITVTTNLGTASIHLAKGTLLTDGNGEPLQGSIDISLSNFDAGDNGSRQAFPGDFIGLVDSAGIQKQAFHESAAFFNLTITDDQGRQVHRISQGGLTTIVRVDPTATNLVTGEPVKAGDDIPFFSYDEFKGQWNYEGTTKVTDTGEGLTTAAILPHLTWYNFGWNYNIVSETFVFSTYYGQYMEIPVKYKVKFSYNRGGLWMYYKYLVFEGYPVSSSMYYMQPQYSQAYPDRWFRLSNFWTQRSMMDFVNLDNTCGDSEFAFWNTPDPLYHLTYFYSGETAPVRHIPIVPKHLEDASRARISVRIICSDTRQIIIPSQQLYGRFRALGSTCWYYKWVTSGATRIYGIRPGTTYEVQVAYNNRWEPSVPYQYTISNDYIQGTQTDAIFHINMRCR
jgi:hypothetical protein